jgi:ABC-2 type transport system ATP-binding protein
VSAPVIEIRNLTKVYRRGLRRAALHAVRDLNITVQPATAVAFVGPNGAGKTTTILSLLGLLKPNNGTIEVFGTPLDTPSLRRIGYQPEIFHTYPFYTATEALHYYGRLSGLTTASLAQLIPSLLDRVGLADAADRKTATFSKGMSQRLGLAQALLHDPELLVLDEPTSGLDPEGRRLVLEIIRSEKARGRTVFLSSHILSDVERTCDEVIMIRQGQVVYAESLSAFSEPNSEWEIEVLGWTNSAKEDLSALNLRFLQETPDRAVLICSTELKRSLLRRLTDLPVEIGTIQRHRGSSLEDVYMKYVGRA